MRASETRLRLQARPQVLVQLQGDVGVLGRVMGGVLDADLAE
jgi:hypothetical protein